MMFCSVTSFCVQDRLPLESTHRCARGRDLRVWRTLVQVRGRGSVEFWQLPRAVPPAERDGDQGETALPGESDPAGYYGLGCVLARMACARAGANLEARRERRAMSAPTVIQSGDAGLTASRFPFLRHLVEMTIPMMVGMIAGAAIFTAAAGMTVDEALRRHAVPFTLVMAFSMTVPMVAWMRYRGHVWRACTEMGAAMVVPAIPL